MKESPILFNGDMVRAILDGRKTQTRRVVKGMALDWLENEKFTPEFVASPENNMCHLGKVGDQLWVRETWQHINYPFGPYEDDCCVFYRANYLDDIHGPDGEKSPQGKYRIWKPSIHMPRQASRIQLEITNIRVERLQDISDDDAIAEGLELTQRGWKSAKYQQVFYNPPIMASQDLWEFTGGDWNANPWVWVIEFKRVVVQP